MPTKILTGGWSFNAKPQANTAGPRNHPPGRGLSEEKRKVLGLEAPENRVVFGQNRVGEFAFASLQFEDFFLHSVAGNEAVGEDIAGLADAVSTVDRLGLHGRIPPGVEQKHILGGGEIEAKAAGLETDEEDGAGGIFLKAADALLAVAGFAIRYSKATPAVCSRS